MSNFLGAVHCAGGVRRYNRVVLCEGEARIYVQHRAAVIILAYFLHVYQRQVNTNDLIPFIVHEKDFCYCSCLDTLIGSMCR